VNGFEADLKKKDKTVMKCLISATVRKNGDGTILGYQGIVRDVTDDELIRQQLIHSEKLSSIGTFVSGVAHELNNPLTIVMGYAQSLLGSSGLPEELQETLSIIAEASDRTSVIVRNLLNYSRKYKPGKKTVCINEVIENTFTLKEYHMRADNIEVMKDYGIAISGVKADGNQLQQVFMNILTNAVHAMNKSGDSKKLIVKTAKKKNEVIITFENTGPSIPKDKIGQIFDPFFTTKEVGEGTGLGLFVSFGIIKDHGGPMRVENINGSGVRFTIALPLSGEPEKKIEKKELSMPKGIRILYVEDEKQIRDWLHKFLSGKGLSVSTAPNGKEAIKVLEKNEFDVILSDVKMPEMNGIELGEWIQQNRPEYQNKFVIGTGVIDSEMEDLCKKNNWGCVMKPYKLSDLLETVNRMVTTDN